MPDAVPTLEQLHRLLAGLGPQRIWRPVPGPDGTLLAPGRGPDMASLEATVSSLDMAGKTVADLGCNLGYFTFLASRLGARHVVGCDSDPEIIRVANALARLHHLAEVEFAALDFLRQYPPTPCDMALLVDFIGRGVITKGRLAAVAAAATAWGARELFFTLHPVYALDDLPLPPTDLERLHPGFVHHDRFHLADALVALIGPSWAVRPLPLGDGTRRAKAALFFERLEAGGGEGEEASGGRGG